MIQRLRSEGFEPDTNTQGNQTVQRWRLGELKVTIDFLMPPASAHDPALRVQNLAEIVARALGFLHRDFATPEHTGPRRAATFTVGADSELDEAAADAHGFGDDLLGATGQLGLRQIDI